MDKDMKTEEIKKELEFMEFWMYAEMELAAQAGKDFDIDKFLKDSYKRIAERLGVSVEEVWVLSPYN